MYPLEHPLITPRLRIEPVTARLAWAARKGGAMFADELGAEAPAEWCASGLALVARSAQWGSPMPPTRAVAVHLDEGCVIGDVRFEPVFGARREVEIGYSIMRSRRRQGYAVEAAGVVVDWLFAEGGAETIIAGCNKKNVSSVATLRRLGFWLDSTPGADFWWVLTRELRSSARA
jgi:ribosomal-protein-alanine N-acetyltransferase